MWARVGLEKFLGEVMARLNPENERKERGERVGVVRPLGEHRQPPPGTHTRRGQECRCQAGGRPSLCQVLVAMEGSEQEILTGLSAFYGSNQMELPILAI